MNTCTKPHCVKTSKPLEVCGGIKKSQVCIWPQLILIPDVLWPTLMEARGLAVQPSVN